MIPMHPDREIGDGAAIVKASTSVRTSRRADARRAAITSWSEAADTPLLRIIPKRPVRPIGGGAENARACSMVPILMRATARREESTSAEATVSEAAIINWSRSSREYFLRIRAEDFCARPFPFLIALLHLLSCCWPDSRRT